MFIEGLAKTGSRTKDLVKYLSSNDIAVIKHDDIDELAAEALIAAGVKTILNTGKSMTGRYVSRGTSMLVTHNIWLFDTALDFDIFKDGDLIRLKGRDLILNNSRLFSNSCILVDLDYINQRLNEGQQNNRSQLSHFIDNTLKYAQLEKNEILRFNNYPELHTAIRERCVIVVVRGTESRECLSQIKDFIEESKPVLLGVDGGADIIISCGFTPDIIIGDMDSVSDMGIYRSREVILHAYKDGTCPCIDRIEALNIKHKLLPMPGTSEDIALLLAYDKGAASIVLIGGHNSMAEYLERGRQGMGSSLITRFKVEDKLIDFKHFIKLQQLMNNKESDIYNKSEGDLACVKM